MIKDSTDKFAVSYFDELRYKGNIDLQPVFQRKSIWDDNARFGLLDSIYRGYPIPEIFLWDEGDSRTDNFSVIDGQQRLTAILDFLRGKGKDKKNKNYKIKRIPNSQIEIDPDLVDKSFKDLTDKQQNIFLDYKIHVRIIETSETPEIEQLFHRLNTNVYETNAQELRNLIHGDMQKLAQDLGKDFRDYLLKNKITNEKKVERQGDIDEVINEILLCAEKGEITGSNRKIKDNLYKDNKKFERRTKVKNDIIKTKNSIEKLFPGDNLSSTMFSKHTNYLALFTTLYLAITGGFDDEKRNPVKFAVPYDSKGRKKLRIALEKFSSEASTIIEKMLDNPDGRVKASQEVREYAKAFVERHTTETGVRKRKCHAILDTIWNLLNQVDAGKGPNQSDRKWLWGSWPDRSEENKPICITCKEEIDRIQDMDVGHKIKRSLGGENKRTNYHPQHVGCNRSDNQTY